jgi:twitching motility protein PilI
MRPGAADQAGWEPQSGKTSRPAVAFRIEGCFLLAPLAELRGVVDRAIVTRVPGTQPWIDGLSDFGGALIPIVDLASYLGARPGSSRRGTGAPVLVVEDAGLVCGLAVPEILGTRPWAGKEALEPPPAWLPRWLRPYVPGCLLEEGKAWLYFDIPALLGTARILAGAA